uniref:Uncharacterized protein n=1 Tax=Anguilla anguilla TaxID=7936 RepID=A0A0E9SM96_ANGAN
MTQKPIDPHKLLHYRSSFTS